jgi:hypothetical protein
MNGETLHQAVIFSLGVGRHVQKGCTKFRSMMTSWVGYAFKVA